ncbi:MAG TPA: hypothetical protein VG838_05585 [Opitutaceae bacterium]|nr:hypothetical protein [Opitutaceae bacterium]
MREWTEVGVQRLRDAGPVVFFLGMAVLPVFGFPLMPFSLAAGPVFGPTLGAGTVIGCAVSAVAVNVTLSYWLAAKALRPLVARLAELLGYRLPAGAAAGAWQITTIVRVAPGLPFFMQSYLLGLVRVPFGPYVVMSTLIPAAYLTAIILGGDALWQGRAGMFLIAAGLLGLTGAVVHLLRKRQASRTEKQGVAERPPVQQAGTPDGLA